MSEGLSKLKFALEFGPAAEIYILILFFSHAHLKNIVCSLQWFMVAYIQHTSADQLSEETYLN